jgi:hypothetical protein
MLWLKVEFMALALLLPVIVVMLVLAIAIVQRVPWLGWAGAPGAVWLGIKAWKVPQEIGP